jgi:hypothetical protein
MRAGWLVVGASVLACGAVVLAGPAGQDRGRNRSSRSSWGNDGDYNFNVHSPRGGDPVTSCDQLEVTVRNGELARDEEVQNVPAPAQMFAVSGARNGPVVVYGADRADYQLMLCKFTAAETQADAQAKLANLSLTFENGRAGVNGPGENGYLAYLIVEAPRNAQLSVDVMNGPLDLRSLSGHIVARTVNGPLSMREVSGDVEVQAQNGPVSLSKGGGRMRVTAQNGPLSVALTGTDWQGAGLEAHAHNGPLSLSVPDDYRSGVLVNLSTNGPFSCASSACRGAQRNWDDRSRTLRFGSDPNPTVQVTADNGPVSIGSGRKD